MIYFKKLIDFISIVKRVDCRWNYGRKKEIKVSLSTVFLIFKLIVIIVMIYYIYVDMVWKNIRNLMIFNK